MSNRGVLAFTFLFLAVFAHCRNVIPLNLKTKRTILNAVAKTDKYTPPDPKKTSHNGTTLPLQQLIFGPIFIGSNHTALEVMYDTGSPWLWVNDVGCSSCDSIFGMDPGYNCSLSTTCNKTDETVFWQYGIGSTDAVLVKDRVTFGKNLTIENYTLGLATEVGDSYDMTTFNGICGLGLGRDYTVIDALKDQHQIQEKVFSLALNSADGTAQIMIGGIDMNFIDLTLPFYTFRLSSRAEWKSDITGIKAFGAEIKNKHFREALFDTGTSHLIFDAETSDNMLEIMKKHNVTCEGLDSFALTCTVNQTVLAKYANWTTETKEDITKLVDTVFPTLNFSMSNQSFTLEPSYIATECSGDVKSEISCAFQIASFPGLDVLILGDPLYRKYYVAFYEDNDSVLLFHSPQPAKAKLRFKNKPQLYTSSFLSRN